MLSKSDEHKARFDSGAVRADIRLLLFIGGTTMNEPHQARAPTVPRTGRPNREPLDADEVISLSLIHILQRPQTTSSGSRGKRGRYTLDSPPPAAHISCAQSIVGRRYGWVKIISPEKRWNEQWSRCYVLTECVSCHNIQWTYLSNLTRGISKGCQNCSQRPKDVYKRQSVWG